MQRHDRRVGARATAAIVLSLIFLVALTTCTDPVPESYRITATIADTEVEADGLAPGDPLAGGTMRIYIGNDIIVETELDTNGSAEIDVDPGTYIVQVMFPSTDPGCFWGDTITDVELPRNLAIEAFYICSGGG